MMAIAFGASAFALATQAQTVTNPAPNRIISWNLDDYSTINPTDLAGLAPATNWVDTYLDNITTGLPDNTGAATTMNLAYGSFNTYQIQASHPGYDANGTANKEMLNGYLNSGPAAWGPSITNSYVALTNIPFSSYDVVVYFSSDTAGRYGSITDGLTNYYFSVMGSAEISGANALFTPATNPNPGQFPSADFAFFPGLTNSATTITCDALSGDDQWLGIAAFQVIQASNVYVLYGPSPASQIISIGQPASFSVLAGGLNPSFQWQHAGTNIVNATNATYRIAATVMGQDGNYVVVVTNNFSSVTSIVATLTFYSPKIDTWAGIGSAWDTSSLNWTVNGGASTTNYADTDNVRFDPRGSAQPNVALSGTFSPSSVTVSNASYEFTSGGLAGSGSLHLMSNATLIVDTLDNRSGATLIDSGSTLQLDNGDNAGTLALGAFTNNGEVNFDSSGTYAYGSPIYGTGTVINSGSAGQITLGAAVNANLLVQSGGGTLLLQGANNLTGGLEVDNGTVVARVSGAIGQNTVVLNGGALQFVFANDFPGSAMTLAGGYVSGGLNGNNSYDGAVLLAAEPSDIEVGAGDTFTLNSAAGVNGVDYDFYVNGYGGTGTLILLGTNNIWASVTVNAGALQIGNGAAGSLGGGTITDNGALTFDAAGNLVVTNPITGTGTINQNGAGVVTLTADNNSAGLAAYLNVNSGTLLVSGTSGPGPVTVNGGTFGGTGTVGGYVYVLPGATLAPSASSTSIGTLTLSQILSLGGNVAVNVNTSLSQSNDFIVVDGSLVNTNNGVVTIHNVGPALPAGAKFTLFSEPVSGGNTLTVTGGGALWTNNLAVDGSVSVISTVAPQPMIRNIHISGGNLIISGGNGSDSGSFYVLSSTNLATPLANWTRVSTNAFDGSGNFNITNAVGGMPRAFYILQSQ
jgi:autotransporter-associated beta strand protein